MARLLPTMLLLGAMVLALTADTANATRLRKASKLPKKLLASAKPATRNPLAKRSQALKQAHKMRAQAFETSGSSSLASLGCSWLQSVVSSYTRQSRCKGIPAQIAAGEHMSWSYNCDHWCARNIDYYMSANETCFEGSAYASWRQARAECTTCGGLIDDVNAKASTTTCASTIQDTLLFGRLPNSTAADVQALATENPMTRLRTFCESTCRSDMTTARNASHVCWKKPTNATYDHGHAFDTGFLEVVQLCEGPSQCYSDAFGSITQTYAATCEANGDDGFEALFDFDNRTAAATTVINGFCDGGCIDLVKQVAADYSVCVDDLEDLTRGLTGAEAMCSKHNGEACAVVLKRLEDADCDDKNSTQCGAESTSFCAWSTEDHECYNNASSAQLDTICTPCLDKIVLLSTDPREKSEFMFHQRLLCSKEDDKYCYPIVNQYYDDDVLDFDLTNVTKADAEKMTSNLCAVRTNRKCLTRLVQLSATAATAAIAGAYVDCVRQVGGSTYWAQQFCLPFFHNAMKQSIGFTRMLSFMCSKNDNSTYCVPLMREFTNHTCANNLFRGNCTSDCGDWLKTKTDEMGCCMHRINNVFDDKENENYPRTVTPAVTLSNGSTVRLTVKPTSYAKRTSFNESTFRDEHAMSFAVQCTVLNNSEFRTKATTACKGRTGAAPKRELQLKGLLWSKIVNDPIFKTRLEASLRTDCAAAMGVPEAVIVNGTLIEDKTQELRESSSAARRQTTAAAGTAYEFEVDGDDDDDAAASAEDFDALVSSGKLTVPSAAETIESDCTNCVAQSVSDPTLAPGETQNPNIFASLTGAESSVGGIGSSATSVAAGAAAAVAVAALLL